MSTSGRTFSATNHQTGAVFTDGKAWVILNHAIQQLHSGTVFVERGVYPIGEERNLAPDAEWVSDHDAAAVINGIAGGADDWASKITLHWNPGAETLVAHMNFPTPVSRGEVAKLGFWLRPSHTFSERGLNNDANGGPFRFVLDDSANCTSPEYDREIFHPEWVTAEWKWYQITTSPAVGSELPDDPSTIRCLGLQWFDNTRLDLPPFPYGVTIDDVHGTIDESWITTKSNVKLLGAGPTETKLVAVPGLNHIMVDIAGSNVEFAGFEVDGNYGAQQAIDYAAGMYNGDGGSGSKIHHNYVHHTKGSGMQIRGSHMEIYENWIEWTENPQITLSHAPSSIHVHHNTLRYGFNDGNLWIQKAHDVVMEYNEMYAITEEALSRPDAIPGLPVGGWVPFNSKEGSFDWTLRNNKIYDSASYGVQMSGTDSGVVVNNLIVNSSREGIIFFRDSTNMQLLRNLVENSDGTGIRTKGSGHTISENWTRNNAYGMDLEGSSLGGFGNYAPDGHSGPPSVGFLNSPPATIDTNFKAGASWTPFENAH